MRNVLLWILLGSSLALAQTSFMERDLDGNGRLTLLESGLSSEEFVRLDESGNGELSLGEFEDYWLRIAPAPDLRDAPYGHESSRQVLDLYLPAEPSDQMPLFLWIHGGSWREGDKQACPFQTLTRHGIAVASINYRFIDSARFPAQLDDCQSALDFLQEEADRRGFQFDRITACGLSAGGQLSLMMAARGLVDNAIAFGAPVDLTHPGGRERFRKNLELLVGSPLEEHLEALKAASPLFNLGPRTMRYLLIHGTGDRTIPYQQSQQMAAALAEHGVTVELILQAGGAHTVVGGPVVWNRLLALLKAPDGKK